MEKRKLLLLLCMLLSLAVQAQTATGHLKFKGVPMDGPVDEFVEKIKGNDWQFFFKTRQRFYHINRNFCWIQ